MGIERSHAPCCIRPFVNLVDRKLDEGASFSGTLGLVNSALAHDRFKTFSGHLGRVFEFAVKHDFLVNKVTLTAVAGYEYIRHRTKLPLPSSLVVVAPLIAFGASGSGDTNLGDGIKVQHFKDHDVIVMGPHADTGPIIAASVPKEKK